ncbi:hypothetical protein ACUHMQ_01820 [Chitinimonas sp. PSY-7]|uniref:hypothetical protein n=1 Tax=Chitinimonas sp. PSY-7 TaxID=3459088 RepID=UPI00403FF1A1
MMAKPDAGGVGLVVVGGVVVDVELLVPPPPPPPQAVKPISKHMIREMRDLFREFIVNPKGYPAVYAIWQNDGEHNNTLVILQCDCHLHKGFNLERTGLILLYT